MNNRPLLSEPKPTKRAQTAPQAIIQEPDKIPNPQPTRTTPKCEAKMAEAENKGRSHPVLDRGGRTGTSLGY